MNRSTMKVHPKIRLGILGWALWPLLFSPSCQNPSPNPVDSSVRAGDESAPAADPESKPTGRWHPISSANPGLDPGQREALERLQALPYLGGSRPATALGGVTILNRKLAEPGLNLYNSGHGPEAFLMNMAGKTLHRWSYPLERIWPEASQSHQGTYWRRVEWLPDGDVLAIFEGIGLIRLNKDSELKWAYRDTVHHQAIQAADGSVWTLTRKSRVIPRINPNQPVWEDFLVQLSDDGRPLREISLLMAFESSPYRRLLEGMKREGDIFHTNSIEFLDGSFADRAPWLKRGNVLLSAFFLDAIFVLDLDSEKIVWALRGDGTPTFKGQHDPRLLANGHLLLFDNWGRSERSKVIEFDPITRKTLWQYPTPGADLHTPTCGTAQRLGNGNTLITESDRGRALEVTPDGQIVWEFQNPHRAGVHQELIATLFEVRRVPPQAFRWVGNVDGGLDR